jgi:zinc transporter, ZIP family
VVMAVGTGILIGSVAFELIDDALETQSVGWVALLTLVGAGVFAVGDWVIDKRGGAERKDPTGKQSDGAPLAIVLGSVLDGIPESFVLGLTVVQGGVSLPLLAGILLSNFPEGMASSSGLRAAGWPRKKVVVMWLLVMVVSALSAAAGFVLLDPASGLTGALVQAFAAGALLSMLADTLLPEAYEVEGVLTGPLVATGFAISLALAAI